MGDDDRKTGLGGGVLNEDAGRGRSVQAAIALAFEVAVVEGVAAGGDRRIATALVRAASHGNQEEKRQGGHHILRMALLFHPIW
jgi:hypothetical protein